MKLIIVKKEHPRGIFDHQRRVVIGLTGKKGKAKPSFHTNGTAAGEEQEDGENVQGRKC